MDKYYVNKKHQANGDHEVHKEDCYYLPDPINRKFLGMFSNCFDAVKEAKKTYPTANGCYHCCYPCHTQ